SISLTDVKRKLAFAAIGDRFRVAGLAYIERPGAGFDARRFDTLKLAASAVLPDLFGDNGLGGRSHRPLARPSHKFVRSLEKVGQHSGRGQLECVETSGIKTG
ncbi:hypothetical protein ACC728_36915, partial [Rhizobium ruizarguesonis]